MFVVRRKLCHTVETQSEGKRNREYIFTDRMMRSSHGHLGTQTRHRADAYKCSAQNIIISSHSKSACVRPINPQTSGIFHWSRDFLQKYAQQIIGNIMQVVEHL